MRKMLVQAIDNMLAQGADVRWAPGYAEPGYDCGEDGVWMADWNTRYDGPGHLAPESRIGQALEHAERAGWFDGVMEWCDEWTTCDDCGRAVRTQPDSMWWEPSYRIVDDCVIVCRECNVEEGDNEAA